MPFISTKVALDGSDHNKLKNFLDTQIEHFPNSTPVAVVDIYEAACEWLGKDYQVTCKIDGMSVIEFGKILTKYNFKRDRNYKISGVALRCYLSSSNSLKEEILINFDKYFKIDAYAPKLTAGKFAHKLIESESMTIREFSKFFRTFLPDGVAFDGAYFHGIGVKDSFYISDEMILVGVIDCLKISDFNDNPRKPSFFYRYFSDQFKDHNLGLQKTFAARLRHAIEKAFDGKAVYKNARYYNVYLKNERFKSISNCLKESQIFMLFEKRLHCFKEPVDNQSLTYIYAKVKVDHITSGVELNFPDIREFEHYLREYCKSINMPLRLHQNQITNIKIK